MRQSVARGILDWMTEQRDDFIEFVETLARFESPSDVPDSQHAPRETLAAAFDELGFRVHRIPGRNSGGQLFARPTPRDRAQPMQLMLGHYDTVWPVGTLENMPLVVEENAIKGPGVYDMKGGIAQMIFALRALRDLGLEPELTPLIFLNSDEEIGSRESTRYIRQLAKICARVFVLEPSLGPAGKLKTARKGVGRFNIVTRGKAAHAGLNPEGGVSAILEMSHAIQQLFALNDDERGITVNVGTVDGGLRPNVIAPECSAAVDVRIRTHQDADRIERAILGLRPENPDVRLEAAGHIGRPPLEPTPRNQALWKTARALGDELGITLEQGTAGGGSDGNTTSEYTATLDGLGAVGDGAHAHHEFFYLDRTLERAALLALLLLTPEE
ncbi:MAG: M20 family metallopeptidase [Pseudomonadota bacterium]|nr:M20 family metallopeptidase [Pseudomonadota bacterium]